MQEAEDCDVMIVIGSSLVVYPAAYVPIQAQRAGARLVIINKGPTEQDHLADVRIDAAAGQTMTEIINELKNV
jgi:NAD-dependent deacetylase